MTKWTHEAFKKAIEEHGPVFVEVFDRNYNSAHRQITKRTGPSKLRLLGLDSCVFVYTDDAHLDALKQYKQNLLNTKNVSCFIDEDSPSTAIKDMLEYDGGYYLYRVSTQSGKYLEPKTGSKS